MIHIAFPLMISTSTEAMLMFIDRLYLKQISAEAMNACLSGGFTSFAFVSFFIGIIGFSTALVAQYFGADLTSSAQENEVGFLWHRSFSLFWKGGGQCNMCCGGGWL